MNHSVLTASPTAPAIDGLRATIAGAVHAPGDPGYDEVRSAFNLALDLRPAAVVVAESAADVVNTIRFARSAGLRVAPQGTSHGAGALGDLEDAILLRTTQMRGVEEDGSRTVTTVWRGLFADDADLRREFLLQIRP